MALVLVTAARGQEGATPPHWIWYPTGKPLGETPAGSRYFRKSFLVKEKDSRLVVDATADNACTLYLDGQPMGTVQDWQATQHFETRLGIGRHVLAAVASNAEPGPAGLLVGGGVLPLGQGIPIHTNSSWKTADQVPPGDGWTGVDFDDSRWVRARDLGPLGSGPWAGVATVEDAARRFRVPDGFRVEMVASPRITGSVVAFSFDEEGAPCIAVERGPIARLIDDDHDGRYDRREPVETRVTNCQGLAFLRGRLFAVGRGPQGDGLYRLSRSGKSGTYGDCELLRGSKGGMGEHGPHAVALGPDGALYYGNGNHAHLKPPIDPHSPVNLAYEGELLPHYNDSRGHAAGILAPGGEIYRSDDQGRTWTRIVAGFRNQYDFAFNREGELFTFDSDMEWDVGLPWYRPVRVNHCTLGANFGWRNGSGKWPAYYADSLPSTLDIGRGSPTGVTFYQARQFPPEYHDSFLICDWSQGRILAVRLERRGATYAGTASELVSGQPLNCTDIEVGPDGAVYFTTGGRGTQGGLFRVSWDRSGTQPGSVSKRFPFRDALAIDSPLSAFSQHRIEAVRDQDRAAWTHALEGVARNVSGQEPAQARVRALELLRQFGPQPSEELLIPLARDPEARVRSRAVGLLGLQSSPAAREVMVQALVDPDPFVRRHACEGLMQQPAATIPIAQLLPMLADRDRWLRSSARVAIEHGNVEGASARILALGEPRPLVEGMLAIVRSCRLDEPRQDALLRRQAGLLRTRLEPELTCDLLRVIELTFLLGPRKADAPAAAGLRPALLGLFSTSVDSPVNREAARLLAFLGEPQAVAAIVQHQATVADHAAQIHDAYCLRAMKSGWTSESKRRLWAWYQTASHWEGGYSFQGYLDRMIQELVALLDDREREEYLAEGSKYPFPTRVLVRVLDVDKDPRWIPRIAAVCGRLDPGKRTGAEADLRQLVMQKLGRSRRPEAQAALAELARTDPRRRNSIAGPADSGKKADYTLPMLVAQVLRSGVLKTASARRGEQVIERAKCLECHKFGSKGEGLGPDLTTVSSRFRPEEILESIAEPSKVVSDQYKSLAVATADGKVYNGMPIVSDGPNLVLLLSDGTKVTIPRDEIDARKESNVSVMPVGLVNSLSPQEIADLLALFNSAPRAEAPVGTPR
ncbi:MAG TPA: HEAT repeat domain-containing protein [Isosphaeraceae bacterium]|nr:HEAT repeat domain-containing protein [Isosphaeraceae bacterium]